MTDLESLKVYYYESASWNQLTGIVSFPEISKRMDNFSICTVEISDFEGALFTAWEARDFTQMKIEDADSNILFQGYLKSKKFTEKSMILTIYGFAIALDWIPFNTSFILAEGLIKTVPDANGYFETIDVGADGYCLCEDGTYLYVYESTGDTVDKYNLQTGALVGAAVGTTTHFCHGMCWDGTYFVTLEEDSEDFFIRQYNAAWVLQNSYDVDETHLYDICTDGTFYYVLQAFSYPACVYKYNAAGVLQDTINIGSTYFSRIGFDGEQFFLWDSYSSHYYFNIWDNQFGQVTYTSPYLGFAITNFVVDSDYIYILINADETVYRYHKDGKSYVDDGGVSLKQDDEDAGYPDFSWGADYWIANRDTGLLIRDNTQGDETTSFRGSALTPSNHDYVISGDEESTWVDWDADSYSIRDTGFNAIVSFTMDDIFDGVAIDTDSVITKITINYHYDSWKNSDYPNGSKSHYIKIELYDGNDWIEVYSFKETTILPGAGIYGSLELTSEDLGDLTDFLTEDGGVYDALKGLRFRFTRGTAETTDYGGLFIDYLTVDVLYNPDEISPIMEKIYDSSTTWVQTRIDFSTAGVQVGDSFQIGECTAGVIFSISDVLLREGLDIDFIIYSTLDKYLARKFKGTNCMEVLRAVCQLEALHWVEDHVNKRIILAKVDDFADSGIDLTASEYERDWDFEDECNHYKGVLVNGNAGLNITATAIDEDSTSLMWKQIDDDTIMTLGDAQAVADAQLVELQDKRPSIKLTITDTDGSYSALEAMKTVDITLSRPTVAGTSYPMRRVDIERVGEHLKYTIYAGLGSTPEEEKQANYLRELSFLAHKTYTYRLANTPLVAGVNMTPDGIAGLDTYIESFITTSSDVLTWLKIGSANADWHACPSCDLSVSTRWRNSGGNYSQVDAASALTWEVDLDPRLGDKKLKLKTLKIGINTANANNKITNVYMNGLVFDGATSILSDATARTAQGEYEYDLSDHDCSEYDRVVIYISTAYNADNALKIAYVKTKYYYD